MSSVVFTRFLLRPGADPAQLGARAREFCNEQRSLSELVESCYYWCGRTSVVVLTEFRVTGHGAPDFALPAGGNAARAFSDIAYQTDFEVWQREPAAA